MYNNRHQVLRKTTQEAFQLFIYWTKQYTIIFLLPTMPCLIQEILCVYLNQWNCVPVTLPF